MSSLYGVCRVSISSPKSITLFSSVSALGTNRAPSSSETVSLTEFHSVQFVVFEYLTLSPTSVSFEVVQKSLGGTKYNLPPLISAGLVTWKEAPILAKAAISSAVMLKVRIWLNSQCGLTSTIES